MIRIENIEVFNFEGALRGMRNPLESWSQFDSYWWPDGNGGIEYIIGDKDKKLAIKLIKAGTDHSKFMRQIFVSMDITAPDYWFKEFDTYKIGTVANSTSTMHKLATRTLALDDYSFDEIDEDVLIVTDIINKLIINYQKETDTNKKNAIWRKLIQLNPMGFLYMRTVTMNYQNLRNMYHSRRNHKLKEWRDFCRVIEISLPYSEFITC